MARFVLLSVLLASFLPAVAHADVPPPDDEKDDKGCDCRQSSGGARTAWTIALTLPAMIALLRRRR